MFLLDHGGVRLLDFGLARVKKAAPLTAAGTVMGSPSFMAPEAWKGQSELVDHRADVYSLGVILFRVLTGELPFSGETLYEKFLSSTKGARPSLLKYRPDFPRDADDWIEMALAVDRDDRFSTIRALWSAFLDTFDVKPPKQGHKPSFWAAAKQAVQRLARSDPPKDAEPSFDREALLKSAMPALGVDSQPSAPSPGIPAPAPLPRVPPPAGRRPPPPPPRAPSSSAEHTVEITDVDFADDVVAPSRPREMTLELSDVDLELAEDTLPDGVAPQSRDTAPGSAPRGSAPTSSAPTSSAPTSSAPTSSAPTSSAPSSAALSDPGDSDDAAARKRERNRRRRERKKRRKNKAKNQ